MRPPRGSLWFATGPAMRIILRANQSNQAAMSGIHGEQRMQEQAGIEAVAGGAKAALAGGVGGEVHLGGMAAGRKHMPTGHARAGSSASTDQHLAALTASLSRKRPNWRAWLRSLEARAGTSSGSAASLPTGPLQPSPAARRQIAQGRHGSCKSPSFARRRHRFGNLGRCKVNSAMCDHPSPQGEGK